MQDVRLAIPQIRLHVLDQILEVDRIRLVRTDVLGCVYGIKLNTQQGAGCCKARTINVRENDEPKVLR